ncbi:DUF6262 family protein [Streptomyces pathocidini]|uniref:DUF6262 family protein n=1 Tax=Streptomyces pathocidini TaxID=1650571 RepID=A0ABW7UZC9_9ACTN|nr:DUF6262 family protein [Streptomyces pathocidini]
MSTSSLPAPRTAQALQARRERTELMLKRVEQALDGMLTLRTPITVAAVARLADVSRTFLYEHAEARALIDQALAKAAGRRGEGRRAEHEALEASWKERALNAEEGLKAAHGEIRVQRRQLGELLGQVRDLRTPWDEQDIVRLTTDNANLKRQVHELQVEQRSLQDRLNAARDNARFADRRIAELESQLLDAKGADRQT